MEHLVKIEWFADNHGFPYRGVCRCGWKSKGYVRKEAAWMMADEHAADNLGMVDWVEDQSLLP